MTEHNQRPDPDTLLQQPECSHRGKLKIYFGASAGVGKTYAMLQEARRLRDQGLEVLCGVVETHGREETARLLQGLPQLPRRSICTGENVSADSILMLPWPVTRR